MPSSGKYDRRIQVQSLTTTRDAFKEKVKTWADQKKLWSSVDYGSAGERRIGAAQEQADNLATFTVRFSSYTSTIKAQAHRIRYKGLIWDIESAVPSRVRNEEIIIVAKAIA